MNAANALSEPSQSVFADWVSKYGGSILAYRDFRYEVRFPSDPKAAGFCAEVSAAYPGAYVDRRCRRVEVEF